MKSVFLLKNFKQRIGNLSSKHLFVLGTLLAVSAVSLIGYFVTAPKHDSVTDAPMAQSQPASQAQSESKPMANQSQADSSQSTTGNSQQTTMPSNGSMSTQPAGDTTQQQQSSINVNVTVAGSSSFSLMLPSPANQCDVLSHALGAGKISQLDMRYNSGYGSYGVYKINNIGQANQIWWTFRVNGVSPSKGCSYVPANNYDQIVWEYIGP